MTELKAIRCANHLANCGLIFNGSTEELATFTNRRMSERQVLTLNSDYLRFRDDILGDPRPRILRECRSYIYDYVDYRHVIKMFIKREYNKRLSEETI